MFCLRPRRSDQTIERRGGRYVLQGERDWLLDGTPSEVEAAHAVLGSVAERLSDGLLLLRFGNAVGLFELPEVGTVEVVAGKWGHADYERMLADLTEIAVGLPFTANQVTALPYARDAHAPADVLYHAFVYLRYVLSDRPPAEDRLLSALRLILHEPYQRLEATTRGVPLVRAGSVSPAALHDVLSSARGLHRAGTAAHLPLARVLRGHLPQDVQERGVQAVLDTPENRFVKAFLNQALSIIGAVRHATAVRRRDLFAERLLNDCRTLEAALVSMRRHRVWHQVGGLAALPTGSPVLQHRRGYRDVYRHYSRLHLATRLPLDDASTRDLLEAKDIALLYELWCFFTVARELEALLGHPTSAARPVADAFRVSVPWDLEVVWESACSLYYSPRFSRSRPPDRHAYSTPLRSDIGLRIAGWPNSGWHLLDAKFRLDRIGDLFQGNDDVEDERAEERRGTFTRADLYKMHTYRDAIPMARSAWVLYPGDQARFYRADSAVAASAFADLPGAIDGIGAVPLLPGQTHTALRTLLRRLLQA